MNRDWEEEIDFKQYTSDYIEGLSEEDRKGSEEGILAWDSLHDLMIQYKDRVSIKAWIATINLYNWSFQRDLRNGKDFDTIKQEWKL